MNRNAFQLGLAAVFVGAMACNGGNSGLPPGLGGEPPTSDASNESGSDAVGIEASADASAPTDASVASEADASDADAADGSSDGGPGADGGQGADDDVRVGAGSDAAMAEPSCSPNTTWSAPTSVAGVPIFASQPFVTVTSDELTVAWVLEDDAGPATVNVADRASSEDPFGGSTALTSVTAGDAGATYFAFDRVGMSGDGLTLVGVALGRQAITSFSRADRGQPFGGPAGGIAFQTFITSLSMQDRGGSLGDPVLSNDGNDLFLSVSGGLASTSMFESTYDGVAWSAPTSAGPALQPAADAGHALNHPTSLSGDGRTLFYWDDGSNQTYEAQRGSPSTYFNITYSFEPWVSVQTNAACTRIYYVASSPGGYTLVQVDAMPSTTIDTP